jgi:hypothetical protein
MEYPESSDATASHNRSHRDLRRTSYQDIIPTLTSTVTDAHKIRKAIRKRRRSSTSSAPEDNSGSEFSPGIESDEDDDEFTSGQEGKSPLIEDEDLITDDMDEKTPSYQEGQVIAIQDDGNEALYQVIQYIQLAILYPLLHVNRSL